MNQTRRDEREQRPGPTLWRRRLLTSETSLEASAVVEPFVGFFQHYLQGLLPNTTLEHVEEPSEAEPPRPGTVFRLIPATDGTRDHIELFGARHRLIPAEHPSLSELQLRLINAIGSVMSQRYHRLFQISRTGPIDFDRGLPEDHIVAAFVEPEEYQPQAEGASRAASTIQTLRTAALSTYENYRVSTGVLLLGAGSQSPGLAAPSPPEALPYNVEVTRLKSLYRLCDGCRTLFLVDRAGKLAGILDIADFARRHQQAPPTDIPACSRTYQAHAQATRAGGHLCLVLSPNQEIKLFAEGVEAFAFTHGRWRMLELARKFHVWNDAVQAPELARTLFQAALNLAESRQGALLVVASDACAVRERLIASHDLLEPLAAPTCAARPSRDRDPIGKRALHYLVRGHSACELDPQVLEALASLDGALVTDRSGRLLTFGAILRTEYAVLENLSPAEGARTTAAQVASRHGPVLKVSEDGWVSCYIGGSRAWEL